MHTQRTACLTFGGDSFLSRLFDPSGLQTLLFKFSGDLCLDSFVRSMFDHEKNGHGPDG
jgi:hypothetical protein